MVLDAPPLARGSDFAQLNRLIPGAGLLKRSPGYYALRLSVVAAAYAGGLFAAVVLGDSWWQLAVAAFMGVVFAQSALVAHDLAHRQIFRSRRLSQAAGLVV